MKFGRTNDNKAKKEAVGKIRKTQLITTFGTGSIVELPEYTAIMGATDYWSEYSPRINEPNLQRLLGVKYFKQPYATDSSGSKGNPDVPAFRFPRMHFCSKCGKLDDFRSFGDSKNKKCISCNTVIVPSRFVVACHNGHIEDFPFNWWVHYGNPAGCDEPDNYHKLRIEFKNTTGGLASIVIHCNACKKSRSMEGCMSENALAGYRCRGHRPWIGPSAEKNDVEKCNAQMRALQRGASNVYFSVKKSALTIPPFSSRIQSILDTKWETIQNAFEQGMDGQMFQMLVNALFKSEIDKERFTVEDFISEINKRRGVESGANNYNEHMMFEDEYKALCSGYSSENEGLPEEFQAEIADVPYSLQEYFDEVVLVKRLREVLALRGFRRVTPSPKKREDGSDDPTNLNEYTTVWDKSQVWLPAIEMRGEGIFIKLSENKVIEWEKRCGNRYDEMKKRLGDLKIGKEMFSPRYVLLHTLSHLLIRRLTIDCGYQEAALKERIYSSYEDGSIKMAGILIYTSASDSDGSLGGLVRQGEPDLLEETVFNALQEAFWCSSDPLCSESKAQGYNSLNYAACHACTLLPETSCEASNCLLDRVAIVGKNDDRSIGFFGELMGGNEDGNNDSFEY